MISEEDYKLMKQLVSDYENGVKVDTKSPYITTFSVNINKEYNPDFGR